MPAFLPPWERPRARPTMKALDVAPGKRKTNGRERRFSYIESVEKGNLKGSPDALVPMGGSIMIIVSPDPGMDTCILV